VSKGAAAAGVGLGSRLSMSTITVVNPRDLKGFENEVFILILLSSM
jgi:hypothetical protein